jgi:tetratricopeptide (TPR) repeat protein
MKELLKKYKDGVLNDPTEQEQFVNELLEIRAARQQKNQAQTPVERPTQMRVVWFKYLAVAASLCLGIFTIWRLQQPNGSDENSLRADIATYSKNFEVQTRGGQSPPSSSLAPTLMELYQNGEFEAVVIGLENKIEKNEQETLLLGFAYANLKTPNYQKALAQLQQVNSVESKHKVLMMKALCHLGLKQKAEAKIILEQIINDNNQGDDAIAKAKALLLHL